MTRRAEIPYPALGLLWPERSIAQSLLQHYDVDPDEVGPELLLDFAQTVGEELLMLARDYLAERGLLRDEDVSPELADPAPLETSPDWAGPIHWDTAYCPNCDKRQS